MSDQRVYLDDIYANEECQGSVFRAVIMMAKEARFLNDQGVQGYIQLSKKPTTIAMNKFKEHKLSIETKASNDVTDEAVETPVEEITNFADMASDANSAF